MHDTQQAYTAAFVIFRRGDKVAFVLRKNTKWMNGHYGLIAGKVEHGESFLQAAIREAHEEAGVALQPENLQHVLTVHRQGDSDGTVWVDTLFEAIDWPTEPYNAEPHQHESLEWLDLHALPENVIPVSKFYFEQIAAGNAFAEYNWS